MAIRKPMIDIEQAAQGGIDLTNNEKMPAEMWEQELCDGRNRRLHRRPNAGRKMA